MRSDLFSEIIASGVSEKDAENAIELARMVKRIDKFVYSEPCPIGFVKKSPFERVLRFSSSSNSYLISISETSKRVERVEFSLFLNDEDIISKEEKFMALTVNEIRKELQKTGIRLFTPDVEFRNYSLRNILEKLTLIEGHGLKEDMFIYDKRNFDAQLITLISLYYYKLGASLPKISQITTWQPK